jgi:hypothetical protein
MTTVAVPEGGRTLDYPAPPVEGMEPGPNSRQALAHSIECDELLYGGARGGGKTDYAIAEALCLLYEFPGMKGVIFRRSYPELMQAGGVVERLMIRLPQSEAKFIAGPPPRWEFANGSKLWAAHLTSQSDVARFLGGEYQLFVYEQAEQVDELTYRLLMPSLRVSGDLARRMREAGYRPKTILTANPGTGPYTEWLRERFVDAFPGGEVVFKPRPTEDEPSPGTRCFIPAFLDDNPALAVGDPTYRRRLESLPPDQRAAQLYGDWYSHAAMRFRQFSHGVHVVEPSQMEISIGGTRRGLGIDYGSTAPFVGLWGAIQRINGEDAFVVYREVDATGLTPRQQAELLLDSEAPGERANGRPLPTALDPSCWTPPPDKPLPRTGKQPVLQGPPAGSIADSYWRAGLKVKKADNRRIDGAVLIDELLTIREDGRPRLYIYSTCPNLIKTLPKLQRDPKRPEDVVGKDIDHWYDALRYLLMMLSGRARQTEVPTQHAKGRPAPPSTSPASPVNRAVASSVQRMRRIGF